MPDNYELIKDYLQTKQLGRINEQLGQLRNQSQGPPCPLCGGPIPKLHVKICMHCKNKISWVDSTPCEPGREAQTKAYLNQQAEAWRVQRENLIAEQNKNKRIAKYVFFTCLAIEVGILCTGYSGFLRMFLDIAF